MDTITSNSPINVAVGPAGRAMAQPMESSLVEAFHQHLTMERNG